MSNISADFTGQLAAFAAKTGATLAETHRAICVSLFSSIIQLNPVATGESVGAWVASEGNPLVSSASTFSRETADAAMRVAVTAQFQVPTYFSNGVAHTVYLEYGTASYGYSPKAPAGMVRVNIANLRAIVSRAVAGARK